MSFNESRDIDNIPFISKEARTNAAARKVWRKDQGNEHTRVNSYKEGVCYGHFGKDYVSARMADVCADCRRKRGAEAIMNIVSTKIYGYCNFCGTYKFDIAHINIRVCIKCNDKIARLAHEFNKKGGQLAVDPFWLRQRKKFGKDYKELFMSGWIRKTI